MPLLRLTIYRSSTIIVRAPTIFGILAKQPKPHDQVGKLNVSTAEDKLRTIYLPIMCII